MPQAHGSSSLLPHAVASGGGGGGAVTGSNTGILNTSFLPSLTSLECRNRSSHFVGSGTEAQRAHVISSASMLTTHRMSILGSIWMSVCTSRDGFNLYVLRNLINSQTLKSVTIVFYNNLFSVNIF